jgi:hypothetical protein
VAGTDRQLLCLIVHHAYCDGLSLGVLLAELKVLYAAHVAGCPAALPELPLQYADFAVWQRERLAAGELEKHLDYWERQLAGLPVLDLPADRPRPARPSFRGELISLQIRADLRPGQGARPRGRSDPVQRGNGGAGAGPGPVHGAGRHRDRNR